MDIGEPISYQVLRAGTPVYSAEGEVVGKVAHVLAAEDEDIFDGIVIAEHLGSSGHRFADAGEIAAIGEQGVLLSLDRAACEQLPEPAANPAVMREDPAQAPDGPLAGKLKRAWDRISGNY